MRHQRPAVAIWLTGPDAVAELLEAEEFQEGYRVTGRATRPTEDGAVVEVGAQVPSRG